LDSSNKSGMASDYRANQQGKPAGQATGWGDGNK
jgi:hypothetical protein